MELPVLELANAKAILGACLGTMRYPPPRPIFERVNFANPRHWPGNLNRNVPLWRRQGQYQTPGSAA